MQWILQCSRQQPGGLGLLQILDIRFPHLAPNTTIDGAY